MNIEQTYRQLTGIDIEVQKRIWDERAIGYYGEFLVFSELYKNIPGNCKILMNLEIPVPGSGKTEIDLLLIHETGLYVFEIKHYKGTIYGNDTDAVWTQYFRTAKNSVFKNPVLQNGYHVRALMDLFPTLPIYSFVVFTNDDCDIKVTSYNPNIDICRLKDLVSKLVVRFSKPNILSMEKINNIFTRLIPYSKLQEPVILNDKAAPFYTWLQPILNQFNQEIQTAKEAKQHYKQEEQRCIANYNLKEIELDNAYKKKENRLLENNSLREKFDRKAMRRTKIATTLVGIACVALLILFSCSIEADYNNKLKAATTEYNTALAEIEASYNAELEQFNQKFLHVDQIGNDYIDDLASYVNVTDVSISPLTDDAVEFAATVSIATDVYGCRFAKDSKYIVMTESGTVYEYDVYGEHFSYNFYHEMWQNYRSKIDFKSTLFYGITDPETITYIKITNISIFKVEDKYTTIKDGLEIELYDKSKQSETPDEIPE